MLEVLAGEYAEVGASWQTSPDFYGTTAYTISLRPMADGIESNVDNNTLMVSVDIMPQTTVVKGFHVFPNPADNPAQARLGFEILHPEIEKSFFGEMELWIFDLEGNEIGHRVLRRSHIGDKEIAIGKNTVDLDQVLSGNSDLPPGLYMCFGELTVTGFAGSATASTKFAVAR
jgi:hypothetical protein